jgi:hypothetical protein
MTNKVAYGQKGLVDDSSSLNVMQFAIRQALQKHRTVVHVVVKAVHGGGVGPAPTVDVQPLVNMTDGQGNAAPHGIISGIGTTRNQGGSGAIINDPRPGDIGVVVVGDRDSSALRANKGKASNPGSRRMGNLADGTYIGATINPANPDQAVQFTETGLRIFDKNGNVLMMDAGKFYLKPGGPTLFLGGTGDDGAYDFVMTESGPSSNVKAKL